MTYASGTCICLCPFPGNRKLLSPSRSHFYVAVVLRNDRSRIISDKGEKIYVDEISLKIERKRNYQIKNDSARGEERGRLSSS